MLGLAASRTAAAQPAAYPAPVEGDFVIRDFAFGSGERLPELRIHYRTLGTPVRDARGIVRNAVLVLHGTTGSGANFLTPTFAGRLFGAGQLLDARRYFIILPDGIGHGRSSRPSEELRARFPRYTYDDMVRAQPRVHVTGWRHEMFDRNELWLEVAPNAAAEELAAALQGVGVDAVAERVRDADPLVWKNGLTSSYGIGWAPGAAAHGLLKRPMDEGTTAWRG